MLNVIALPDARDWHALPYEPRDWRAGLERRHRATCASRTRRTSATPRSIPRSRAGRAQAVGVFADLGAHGRGEASGLRESRAPIFRTHWFSGAAALLIRIRRRSTKLIDPGLLEVAAQGAQDHRRRAHRRADEARRARHAHEPLPPRLRPAGDADARGRGLRRRRGVPAGQGSAGPTGRPSPTRSTSPQQPAASIPCGFTKAGLPVGLHIVGPRYDDALVLRAARAFESVRPVKLPDLARLAP